MSYFFSAFETTRSKAKDTSLCPIEPGQYLICKDSGDVFYDTEDGVRKHLTDIIDLGTDDERIAILTPLDKMYFVKETAHFWRYLNGLWVDVSAATAGGNSKVVYVLLKADAWVAGRQTITVPGLKKDHNGNAGLVHEVTKDQFEAAADAILYPCHQEDGKLTIAAYGDEPAIDIPAAVILLS